MWLAVGTGVIETAPSGGFHRSGQKPHRANSIRSGLYVRIMGSICDGAALGTRRRLGAP